MSITVLTIVDKDINFAPTLASVLESTTKPDSYCLVLSNGISDETKAKVMALFNTCCNNETEISIEDNNTIYKASLNGINVIGVVSNTTNRKSLIELAVKYTKNNTEFYMVLDQGIYLKSNSIELFKQKFNNAAISFVYSDYIKDSTYKYLPNFHPMMKCRPDIKCYAIRAVHSEYLTNSNYFEIASNLYNRSVISKIPEAAIVV